VTKLDSSAAWASAAGMVAANRDVLLAIAGVFFLLPSLAAAVFVPAPVLATGMSEQQVLDALQGYYASSLPVLVLLSLVSMAGMLTMLVAMLDTARPTIGQAIGRSLRAIPSYIGAQLMIALAVLPLAMVLVAVLAQGIAERFAAAIVFSAGLYPIMRTMMVGPVMAQTRERSPIAAIRASFRLTRGNAGRLLTFIGLATFFFLVVYGLIMMLVGVVLVLATDGEPQRLIGEAIAGLLQAIGYTYFVAILAAVYGQLSCQEPDMLSNFD
jgi:hypothetical protein